jgi:hypothetical protein
MIGAPTGKGRVRIFLETVDETYVFEEATMSAIIRGHAWVWNHPKVSALEFLGVRLPEDARKKGMGEYQFVESNRSEDEVRRDIDSKYSNLN